MFPTPPLQTFLSCKPSPGHLTGLSSLERARSGHPPIKNQSKQPNAEQGRAQRLGPAYARRLQGRSTHDAMQVIRRPERQKTALAAQKQREAVLKRWGGAEP